MSSNKKKLILNSVSVKLGCGSCKRPNLSGIFQPKAAHRTYRNFYTSSSASSSKLTNLSSSPNGCNTSSTFSPDMDSTTPAGYCRWPDKDVAERRSNNIKRHHRKTTVRGLGRVGGESVAVEKDSDDPYLDFRRSMLQMILENEIYSKDDLRELLNCFLQLNSPYHHGIIVRAFTEIWNGVFSVRPSSCGRGNATAVSEKLLRYLGNGGI